MDDLHLKLQLTAEDARYVREKFLSAVDEKIKFHLPKDDVFDDGVQQQQQQQQDDPMRIKVEELVKEVSSDIKNKMIKNNIKKKLLEALAESACVLYVHSIIY